MKYIRRLINRWKFSRLSKGDQKVFTAMGIDPDSLIKAGRI